MMTELKFWDELSFENTQTTKENCLLGNESPMYEYVSYCVLMLQMRTCCSNGK